MLTHLSRYMLGLGNLFKKGIFSIRIFLKIIGILFILLLIGSIGSAYFFFETKTGSSLLFKGIHTYLKTKNIDLTLNDLEGDFPKNFSIKQIELKDSTSQKPIFQGENIYLSWDWLSLFQRKVLLHAFTIQKLRFFSSRNSSPPSSPAQTFQEAIEKLQYLFALPYFFKIEKILIEEGSFISENEIIVDLCLSGYMDFNTASKNRSLYLEAKGLSLPWDGSLLLEEKEENVLTGHFSFEDPDGVLLKDYGPFKSTVSIESQAHQIKGAAFIEAANLGKGTLHWEGTLEKDLELPFEGQLDLIPDLVEKWPFLSGVTFQGIFIAQNSLLKLKDTKIRGDIGSLQISNLNIFPIFEQEIVASFDISTLPFSLPPGLHSFLPLEAIEGSVSLSLPKEKQDISFQGILQSGEAISLQTTGTLSPSGEVLQLDSFTFKTIGTIIDGKGSIHFAPEGTSLSLPLTFSLSPQNFYPVNTRDTLITGNLHLEGLLSNLSFQSQIELPFLEWEGDSFSDLSLVFSGTWSNNAAQVLPTLKGIWKEASFTLQSTCFWEEEKGLTLDALSFDHPNLHIKGLLHINEKTQTTGHLSFEGQAFPFLKNVFFDILKGQIAWDLHGIKGDISGKHGKISDIHIGSLALKAEAKSLQGKDASGILEINSLKIGELLVPTLKLMGKGDLEKQNPFLKGSLLITNPSQKDVEIIFSYAKAHDKSTLTLSSFKGDIGKTAFSLPKDLICTYTPSLVDIPKTEFLINKHPLTFYFTKKETSLKGALLFQTLPLKDLQGLSNSFQLPLVLKKGEFLLSGTLQNSQISYTLDIAPAPSSEGWGPAIPPFAGHIQGIGKNHILEGSATLTTQSNLEYVKSTWKIPFGTEEDTHNKPLLINFEGKGSLATLAPFIVEPGDVLKGDYQATFIVKGSFEKPSIQGNLDVKNGSYQNFKFGTLFHDVILKATANNTTITLEQGTAHDTKGGAISLSGTYAWGGASSTLSAQLTNFQIVALDMVNGRATGALSLQKISKTLPTLKGNIQLEPFAVHIPKKLPSHVYTFDVKRIGKDSVTTQSIAKEDKTLLKGISAQTHEKLKIRPLPPYTEEESAVLSNTTLPAFPLDLQVNLPDKFTVEGHGLSSSWAGQVNVGGTLQDPSLSGTIHIQKGTFTFFGKTFSLQKGYLLFTGQSTADPDVDIVAQITTAGITAHVLIGGKLSTPQFTLTSNPSLPSNEIISRILFGKDIGSLSPFQSLQIVSALSDLTGTANPTNIVDQIRDSLGLGGLSFTGNGDSSGGLSLGKYLSDDVFVNVEQGLEEGSTKASVEVKVFPEVTLQSDVGADASAGVGMNWRYEY